MDFILTMVVLILGPIGSLIIDWIKKDYYVMPRNTIIHSFLWVFAVIAMKLYFVEENQQFNHRVIQYLLVYSWPFFLYLLAKISRAGIYDKSRYFEKRNDIIKAYFTNKG